MNDRSGTPRRLLLGAGLLALVLGGAAACGDGTAETPAEGTEETSAVGEAGHAEGETDAVVLDTAAVAVAGIQVGTVGSIETSGLPVTGAITYDADRVSHIGPRTHGRVVALRTDIGQQVRGGQALAILESAEIGQIRAEEHEAEALARIARENHEREARLEAQGISSRKEVLAAQAELRRAEAALQSARERLRVLGAGHGSGAQFAVTAPFGGTVVARHASLGEMTSPSDTLFTVASLEDVWIELDIFERDLARVRIGQAAEVTTTAYPGRSFPGRIVFVGSVLDPQTRTVDARVEIQNRGGELKPGMFATATIQVGGGSRVAVVPQEALQELEGRKVVFVPGDRPGEFRASPVEVGEAVDGNRMVVRAGLKPGDRIVTAGAFALRSELAKGEIGEHGH